MVPPDASRAPRICFVAPKAGPLLSDDIPAEGIRWGGAEVQQVLLGNELARRGYEVHFVVVHRSRSPLITSGGMRLHSVIGPEAGLPGVRVVHPRWTSLWRALAAADADVYYQRGNGIETGQVGLWCRLNQRTFLFGAASDSNADPALPDLRHVHERWMYRLGLRLARAVIVQTESQRLEFERVFRLGARVILSAGPDAGICHRPAGSGDRVLWVGRINSKKRPEWLLDLGERMPEVRFDVAAPVDGAGAEWFRVAAAALPNVKLHGQVMPDQLGELYDQADVVLCTSRTEGFPNVFLEAWARGIPTVSTVDPDGLIGRFRLGRVANSLHELQARLLELLHDGAERRACGRRARAHFDRHHTIEGAADAYERMMNDLHSRKDWPCVQLSS